MDGAIAVDIGGGGGGGGIDLPCPRQRFTCAYSLQWSRL